MSYNLILATLVLLIGIPIGDFLSKITKEEMEQGQHWFKLLGVVGLIGAFLGLVFRNDILLFSFAFIAIVSSRSIKK